MTVVIVGLIVLMIATLLVVGAINRMQQRERQRQLQKRQLRLQADELGEVVDCLEHTIPNRLLAKLFNDAVVALLHDMLRLETKSKAYIETAIQKAENHSDALVNARTPLQTRYRQDSDAQIAKTLLHLTEALNLLPHLAARGQLGESEADGYADELRWAYLMVPVMSYLAQGDKAMAITDRFSAQAFYRKAQQLLMESLHPDPRRLRLVKEISGLIDGSRTSLSQDLRDADSGY